MTDTMQTARLAYKQDDYGNDMYAKVSWSNDGTASPRAIAIVTHGGGLIAGSADMIPTVQVRWATANGFIVVIPNYRLAPQVSGKQALQDCEEAYDWATGPLVDLIRIEHSITIDASRVVAFGHSTGGTIALHLASTRPLKAVTAFHATFYFSDTTTSSHQPATGPLFAGMPDFSPNAEDWKAITPAGRQVTEAALAIPGTIPPPRVRWQLSIIKNGSWPSKLCPDGDFTAIDPLTRLSAQWPPVLLVHGGADTVPGSEVALVHRAVEDMKAAGLRTVRVKIVDGAEHMFDLPPSVGTTDLGPKWEAVLGGLEFLKAHV